MLRSTFRNGIHPKESKHFTSSKPIELFPLPGSVSIPVQQHIGAPCEWLVQKKDEVKTGQVIGKAGGFVSSPVHATITGKVTGIDVKRHPAGGRMEMVTIKRTGEDEWLKMNPMPDWKTVPRDVLLRRISDAGIVGMGGAAFPTHVKLNPPPDKPVDTFILNGCECEPYLTADHRTMVERTDLVLKGTEILMHILGVNKGLIAIEDNKPDAIETMLAHTKEYDKKFHVIALKTKYPQGAEKMLIEAVLHRKVPAGGLPMDIGAVVNNVGTAVAVAEAVLEGKPLIERIVTVTGDGISEPKNILARIGSSFGDIIAFCGGLKDETNQVFMGGPMMGVTLPDLDVPVIKATSGIIGVKKATLVKPLACIQCGSCVEVCPMFLLPTRLARFTEKNMIKQADELGISNCVECGSCSFVCPSKIPIVQWIRIGKHRLHQLKTKGAA